MNNYLKNSTYIDWHHPSVLGRAKQLAEGSSDPLEVARRCFTFVRDDIKHSWDFELNPITCKASDVLMFGTGFCYAKSHLLAALLRGNGIPAGLCYQRFTVSDDGGGPHCLHGLNAVWLPDHGWYRIDARGNKAGVDAQFTPPIERLAFPIANPGEADLPEIWAEPLSIVTEALEGNRDFLQLANNLPDVDLVETTR